MTRTRLAGSKTAPGPAAGSSAQPAQPAPSATAQGASPRLGAEQPPWSRGWAIAVIIALAVTAFAASCTLVWDCDVFWHLASGHWMLEHGKVLGTDPYSIDPMPEWVNVHWLFQVVIAILHKIGGFELLSIFKGVMAALTVSTFAWWLRKHVPPSWLILCGLALLITIAGRVRVRPEAFTLLLLTNTILLVDSVRRGASPLRMWWIVPMTLVWVNMHGIYILGLAVVWSAIACAAFERYVLRNSTLQGNLLTQHAISAAAVATAACLITPWPLEAAIQPLLLWTRVSGNNDFFTEGVSELYPTWKALGLFRGALALAGVTVLAMLVNFVMGIVRRRPRLPLAHVGWFVAFVFLAALAKRNVALIGPICAFLLAWHGKDILMPVRSGTFIRSKLWPAMTVLMLALAALQTAGYATEFSFRKEKAPFRFGVGLNRDEFPIDLAQWLADLPAEGDIFVADFGDASSFIYYGSVGRAKPARLLYMDGRLEAHDESRFINQHNISKELQSAASAQMVELPPSVRFVIVRHDSAGRMAALSQSQRFRLLRIDDTCACFEDTLWATRSVAKSPLPPDTQNLAQLDQPLVDSESIAGTPPRPKLWWRNNPTSLYYRRGEMLLYLGQYTQSDLRGKAPAGRYRATLLACRYLEAARTEGSYYGDIASGMLAQAFQDRAYQNYYAPGSQTPVNMDLARALRLYGQLNLNDLRDESTRRFAEQHLRTLLLAGQTDSAAAAVTRFMNNLPSGERVHPKVEYFDLRNAIQLQMQKAQDLAQQIETQDPLQRARLLTSPQIGLIDLAIAQTQAYMPVPVVADKPSAAAAARDELLFNLLLSKGQTDLARTLCGTDRVADASVRALRDALCDWADGYYDRAASALTDLCKADKSPLLHFYLADLLELTGNYDDARKALDGIQSDDAVLAGLIDRLRTRLESYSK